MRNRNQDLGPGKLASFGVLAVVVVGLLNLALLAGVIAVIVVVLRALGVIH